MNKVYTVPNFGMDIPNLLNCQAAVARIFFEALEKLVKRYMKRGRSREREGVSSEY